MRPVCVECRVEMHCEKNSFMIKDKVVGDSPVAVWSGDKFKCPGCGKEIVVGFGNPMLGNLAKAYQAEALEINRGKV